MFMARSLVCAEICVPPVTMLLRWRQGAYKRGDSVLVAVPRGHATTEGRADGETFVRGMVLECREAGSGSDQEIVVQQMAGGVSKLHLLPGSFQTLRIFTAVIAGIATSGKVVSQCGFV